MLNTDDSFLHFNQPDYKHVILITSKAQSTTALYD